MPMPTQLHQRAPSWYDSFSSWTPISAPPVRSKWWHRLGCGFIDDHGHQDPWWSRAWRKLRAWSSMVVTGPMWKELIRRFKRDRNQNNYVENFNGIFRYNPSDYAKNFDDGPDRDRYFDEDGIGRDFSSRFASARTSCAERHEPLFM